MKATELTKTVNSPDREGYTNTKAGRKTGRCRSSERTRPERIREAGRQKNLPLNPLPE